MDGDDMVERTLQLCSHTVLLSMCPCLRMLHWHTRRQPFSHFCQVNRPYSRCQILKPSLVFLNRASYGRRRNNDVTSQESEVTMMLRHNLRTDVHICSKSANQASLFVHHGRGVNMVYCINFPHFLLRNMEQCVCIFVDRDFCLAKKKPA